MPPRVAILLHERQRGLVREGYRIWALERVWQGRGIAVERVVGARERVDADVLVPHIDLTVMPPEYGALLDAHRNVVNRRVRDTSKRRISRSLVRPDDGYDGPVIVKTDRNHGGLPEADLASAFRGMLARAAPRVRRVLRGLVPALHGLGRARHLDPHRYPVFPSPREVPPEAFENPHLVVERFLPEREGDRYFVRYYSFFGDRHVCLRRSGRGPVVRYDDSPGSAVEVPAEVAAERARLGLDYGKIDFVIHEGKPVLLDVNPTPSLPRSIDTESARLLVTGLAGGIDAFL